MKLTIEPILTEKATQLAQKQVYMFNVSKDSNKHQIKEALEKVYKVEISGVRTTNRKGKTVRRGRKMAPKKMQTKRIVFVTVKKGKIDLFPQA